MTDIDKFLTEFFKEEQDMVIEDTGRSEYAAGWNECFNYIQAALFKKMYKIKMQENK